MTGIIYYNSNYENGIAQLKQIEENYKMANISSTYSYYTRSRAEITFENGDNWKVIRAGDNARGYRWNIAYIERSVDLNTYRGIISCSALSFPFSATRLWGEGNLHIFDEVPLPF